MLLRTFGGWSNFLAVYLSTVTSIALLTHKVVSIALHGPFAAWKVVLFGPFTFCFDVITVLILDYGLRSASRSILSFSVFVSLTIIVCSSTTFAVYQEANTEVQWGRSLEVCIPRLHSLLIQDPWKLGLPRQLHGSWSA
jgi:hypothetical protein